MGVPKDSSLLNICLDVIAKQWDTFSVTLDQQENLGVKRLMQLKWTNALFKKMDAVQRTRHASFFMNSFLKELDFSKFSLAPTESIIVFDIETRDGRKRPNSHQICGDVKRLKTEDSKNRNQAISSVGYLETAEQPHEEPIQLKLANLLPSNLRYLRFHDMLFLDEVLEVVGKNCLNLQELILNGCENVTDEGMIALCFRNQENNMVLRKLDLINTSVTFAGIIRVLDYFPNLTELAHLELGYAISNFHNYHTSNSGQPFRKYNLQTLRTCSKYVRECVATCPSVEMLIMEACSSQYEFDLCANFTKLTRFIVYSFHPLSLSRFFEIRGATLEFLKVYSGPTISVETLARFCSNLKYLNIWSPQFERNENLRATITRFSLQSLEVLEVSCANLTDDLQHFGTLFFASPNIKTVSLLRVIGFSVEFVGFLRKCGIARIINLHVWRCEINVLPLKQFVIAAPNLKYLSISRCKNISQSQCDELKQLKSDLTVDYN